MEHTADKLEELLHETEPTVELLDELLDAWRAAAADERDAFRAWDRGERPHAAFVAALDREEVAARVLCDYGARTGRG